MNEQEKEHRIGADAQTLPLADSGASNHFPDRRDLVVDLTGIHELDVTSLALLLTAQQNAQKEDKAIWLVGVPLNVWQALHAMGLGRFFKPFPVSGELAV
jgi:ABC-type transporter Mla MlaB component